MRLSIILFLSLLATTASYACSCSGLRKISVADILYYDIILTGKIKSVAEDKDKDGYKIFKALFSIKNITKPGISTDTLSIYTNDGESACGLDFKAGDTWLIIGYHYNGKYYASLCSKSINRKGLNLFAYQQRKSFTRRFSQKTAFIDRKVDGYRFTGQLIKGKPDGQWLKRKAADTIEVMNFKDGRRHGFQLQKHECRLSRTTGEYSHGKRHGAYRQYNAEGILTYRMEFSDDKHHGKYEQYLDNGDPYLIGQYTNDKRVGEWKTFVNGRLKYKSIYDNNGLLIKEVEIDE